MHHLSNPKHKKFRKLNPLNIPFISSGHSNVMIPAQSFHRHTPKRPVDKNLIIVSQTSLDSTQQATVLATVTFPCTIVGLRWDISSATSAGTGIASIAWAIVKVSQGDTVNTLATGDGSTLYAPEQNVMTWGVGLNIPEDTIGHGLVWIGDTKTMRKMMGGDTLQFIARGEATNLQEIRGCIQFFCKT